MFTDTGKRSYDNSSAPLVGACTRCTLHSNTVTLESFSIASEIKFQDKMEKYPMLDKLLNQIPNFHFPKIISESGTHSKKYEVERAKGININFGNNENLENFINIDPKDKIKYLTSYIEAISILNTNGYILRDHKPDSVFIDTNSKIVTVTDIEPTRPRGSLRDRWLEDLNEFNDASLKNLLINFFDKNSARNSNISLEEFVPPVLRTMFNNLSTFESASDFLDALKEYPTLKVKNDLWSFQGSEMLDMSANSDFIKNQSLKKILENEPNIIGRCAFEISTSQGIYPTAAQSAEKYVNSSVIDIESSWSNLKSQNLRKQN